MKKQILTGIMAIGITMAMLGAGTFAYFSDTETSTNNTLTAGTLDLKLSNDGSTWTDGVTSTWTSPDWKPGEEVTHTLYIKNTGSIGAYWLYIGIMDTISDPDDLATQVDITEFIMDLWPGYNHVEWMDDVWDGGPPLTLEEFSQYAGTSTPYGFMACGDSWTGTYDPSAPKIIPAGATVQLQMKLLFDPNAGNEYQGKQCGFTLTVIAWNGYPGSYTEIGSTYSYGYGQI